MTALRRLLPAALSLFALLPLSSPARAQLTLVESGYTSTLLAGDYSKQIELGVGPDTCLYYGTPDGLKRRCSPGDPGTLCDPALPFPVGIAFRAGGAFGTAMYVADYGVGGIRRAAGCSPTTPFANLPGPGGLAFPPIGSAYGDYLYACEAFAGPIFRVSPAGAVTSWLPLETLYLGFGPGGAWGTGLYACDLADATNGKIVRVSSSAVVTPFASGFATPEGFDWGFQGDLFATDVGTGEIFRVKPNGTKTLFATLPGAADVAYRPGEQALYAVSNQGGLHRIVAGGPAGASGGNAARATLTVLPNPGPGACALRFSTGTGAVVRGEVWSAAGRRIRRLAATWRPAGEHSIAWDGRNDAGIAVAPGTYFARLKAGEGEVLRATVTVVR
ncbi:MAG: FlgD immunoglobulin-like domain containing protein [Candidatus Eisenbacteria bacterium]